MSSKLSEKYKEIAVTIYNNKMKESGVKITSEDIRINYTNEFEIISFKRLMEQAKKRRVKKAFHISKITKLNNLKEEITPYSVAMGLNKNDNSLLISDEMGVFDIEFSDKTHMIIIKWMFEEGVERVVEGMFVASDNTWKNFFKIINQESKRMEKPKKGIFRIIGNEPAYSKIDNLKTTPVIHPTTKDVLKDLEFFFNNVDRFTIRNQPGTRKIMLVGPPGTGKTSISSRIADIYKKDMCVAFATKIDSLAGHLAKCAKYKVPTIVILEDAESSLGKMQVNSAILNFMDGVDLPRNEKGAYVIMTTNRPQDIEPRSVRSGRVSRKFMFGTLKGEAALDCAEFYFDNILWDDKTSDKNKKNILKKLYTIVHNDGSGMTGAQIKELSETVVAFSVSNMIDDITTDIVEKVKADMTEELKEFDRMAEEEGLKMTKTANFGFAQRVLEEYSGDTLREKTTTI